jgi:hypothetical protein
VLAQQRAFWAVCACATSAAEEAQNRATDAPKPSNALMNYTLRTDTEFYAHARGHMKPEQATLVLVSHIRNSALERSATLRTVNTPTVTERSSKQVLGAERRTGAPLAAEPSPELILAKLTCTPDAIELAIGRQERVLPRASRVKE